MGLLRRKVHQTIEEVVVEELEAVLGVGAYVRDDEKRTGYRHGERKRELTTPNGVVSLTLPRARLFRDDGREEEWRPTTLPRYKRRMREVDDAITDVYLSGVNMRRVKIALRPLLKNAPLSKSAVSRILVTVKGSMESWQERSLAALEPAYVYLDAFAVRVRSAGKVVSQPVMAAVAVLLDGSKQLLGLEMCSSEGDDGWKGFLDDLTGRGLKRPYLAIIDGCAGLRNAVELKWPGIPVQRCAVHKLRNLLRKAPVHAHEEVREDFHTIVYADSLDEAREAWKAFVRKWSKQCPPVVASLEEGGEDLLTFFVFPKEQWRALRSTNVIERLNGEFRRRVKTQSSFPREDAAMVLLYGLVATGQVRFRRLEGHDKLVDVAANPPKLTKKVA
ncbi:MAG: IS256 family transposase [Candidatus Rokuibacteriota bacterium]